MTQTVPKSGEFLGGRLWFTRKGPVLTLGVTSRAIEEIGSVETIEFPTEGDDFDKGEILLVVSGTKGDVEVMTPSAGTVSEVNASAQEEPEVVADDPLEEGWLIRMEIQDPSDLLEFVDE